MRLNESYSDAWQLRFGEKPVPPNSKIEDFLKHRSIRDFSDKPIPEELIKDLIAAAFSAATSSNLQLRSIISIQNPEKKEKIKHLCADQKQITQAPWFFAFLADHHRIKQAAIQAGQNPNGLDYAEFYTMATIDAALAAERMVCAAESIGLGACYIGALRNKPEEISKLLKLPQGVFGLFGLCLGWPAEENKAEIKPRLSLDSTWFKEEYPEHIDLKEYDGRMVEFYESQGMNSEFNWSQRSGRRVDQEHLTGREVLKSWLEKQGFNKR